MSSYLVEHLLSTKQGMISILCCVAVITMPFFALSYNLDLLMLLLFMMIFVAISIINSDLIKDEDY